MEAFLPPPFPCRPGLRRHPTGEKRPRLKCRRILSRISLDAVHFVQYLGAGGICALFSHTAATPLDVVKTRIQSDSDNDQGIIGTTKKIVEEGGIRALLTGANATAIGFFFHGALKYSVYESTVHDLGPILAAITAEAVACLVLCPLESIRIRTVTSNEEGGDGYAYGGVLQLYAGLPPLFFKQAPYTVTQFIAYENAIPLIKSRFIAGFIAGIAAATVSQPADTMLTRINSPSNEHGDGMRLQNLYTGFLPRLLHVTFIVGVQFAIYDSIKRWCGLL